MRRLTMLALLVFLCGMMAGCTSKAAKEVQNQIQAIGEVSVSSGESICEAERLYEELPKEDKEAVENYEILEAARTAYQQCITDEIDSLFQLGNYAKAETLVDSLDSVTLENIKYDILDKTAKMAVIRVINIREGDQYYDSLDVPDISAMVDSARNVAEKLGVAKDDEYYIVVETLEACKAYLEDGIQYLDLLLLNNACEAEFVSAYGLFADALDMKFYTLFEGAINDCAALAIKAQYTGTQEYAKKYSEMIKMTSVGMEEVRFGLLNGNKELATSGFQKMSDAPEVMQNALDLIKEHDTQRLQILICAEPMLELFPD